MFLKPKVKLYSPDEAVAEASRIIQKQGWTRLHKSKDSFYFGKMKNGKISGKKIRISNHAEGYSNDLCQNLVFDYVTILKDIETRVDSAIRMHERKW